jgi:ABC-type nitrate/sulfonate/bicarbonate transport system ATPase subunit
MNAIQPRIAISNVKKVFSVNARAFTAIEKIDLDIMPNQFVAVVGTSGCGKSTLLNMVGGLDQPTAGQIAIDGQPVTGPGRDRGFVFQSYSLFESASRWKSRPYPRQIKRHRSLSLFMLSACAGLKMPGHGSFRGG